MELDGDDVAVTYIKDVVFNANQQDVDVLRMTKVSSENTLSLMSSQCCLISGCILPTGLLKCGSSCHLFF